MEVGDPIGDTGLPDDGPRKILRGETEHLSGLAFVRTDASGAPSTSTVAQALHGRPHPPGLL